MTLKTLGMGIAKVLTKEVPKKKYVNIIGPSWKDKRISAMNRKLKKTRGQSAAEDYAQEASDIYKSKAKTKKEYKAGKK